MMVLGAMGFASAQQSILDTVTTGQNYAHQKFYSLQDGIKASSDFDSWTLGFGVDAFNYDAPIRFNSLIGDIRVLPNADINTALESVDTTGWAAASSLYDQDTNYFQGALSRTTTDPNDLLYFWGKYSTITHMINPIATFGAEIGSDFYLFRFTLAAVQNTYTIEFYKLGDTQSEIYDINLNNYATKNYVYFDVINKNTVDLEPASSDWDLFFGKYYTNYQNIAMYAVAGVLNNVGTQVARVVDANAENYNFTWNETFSAHNNVIGYDWKQSGQTGVTMADSIVYFVKAKNGEIWKLFFTNFISGTGNGSDAGSYIFKKELVSSLSTQNHSEIFTEMYPNPTNNTLQIVVDANNDSKVDIFSTTGAKVYSSQLENGLQTHTINTSSLLNGIYQVVISTNNQQVVKRLAVQH